MVSSDALWLALVSIPIIGLALWLRIARHNLRPFATRKGALHFVGLCLFSSAINQVVSLVLSVTKGASFSVSPTVAGALSIAAGGGYLFWSDKRQKELGGQDRAALSRLATGLAERWLESFYWELTSAKDKRCTRVAEDILKAFAMKYGGAGFDQALDAIHQTMDRRSRLYPGKTDTQRRVKELSAARDLCKKKSDLWPMIELAYNWRQEGRLLKEFGE